MFTKNALIATAIIVTSFSATSAFADDGTVSMDQSTGPAMGQMGQSMGQGMPMMDMQMNDNGQSSQQYPMLEKMLSNTGVVTAIQNAGLTVPTAEEMKNFHTAMEAARTAEKSLSDENKAGLEALRKTFRKQERDYLRSVGVAYPAEAEIEKYQKIHEVIQSAKPIATQIKKEVKKEVKQEVKNQVKKQMKKPAVKKMIKNQIKNQTGTNSVSE